MKKFLVFAGVLFCTVTGAHAGDHTMKISSPSFESHSAIPIRFTCEGEDINPALHIQDIPAAAQELALVVTDPDAPNGMFIHWVVYNIPVTETISENSVPGKQGINDFGKFDYGGPCPPRGKHRYIFTIYALDAAIVLPEGVHKKDLESAMSGHILAKDELVGFYQRKAL